MNDDRKESQSLGALYAAAFQELRAIAGRQMLNQPRGHTLQATALVNEVFVRLRGWDGQVHDKEHLVLLAAQAMRQILVDYSRRRAAVSRMPESRRVSTDGILAQVAEHLSDRPDSVELIDHALSRLEQRDPEIARLVELHSFGGMSIRECVPYFSVSQRTLERWWRVAQGMLRVEIEQISPERKSWS